MDTKIDDEILLLIRQLSDPSPTVQDRAIECLHHLGEKAVPALKMAIPLKMGNQIIALARIGYPQNAEAIRDLVEELKFSGSFPPKDALISNALVEIGEPVLEYLARVLKEHPENELWIREVSAILSAFETFQIDKLTPELINTLEVGLLGDSWFYIGIIGLLGRIGSPKATGAIPIICKYYEKGSGAVGPSDYDKSENIREAFNEAKTDIRNAAIRALRGFRNTDLFLSIPTLKHAVADPIVEIRQLAIEILERLNQT
jgi:hypothetical protein